MILHLRLMLLTLVLELDFGEHWQIHVDVQLLLAHSPQLSTGPDECNFLVGWASQGCLKVIVLVFLVRDLNLDILFYYLCFTSLYVWFLFSFVMKLSHVSSHRWGVVPWW